MKIEDIREQCQSLSNEELLLILNNKIRYTEAIVTVARNELRKRAVPKEEIKQLLKKQALQAKIIDGDIHQDILFFEKIGFFFVFIPLLHRLIVRDYARKGYFLKVRQSIYYYLCGGISFFALLWLKGDGIVSLPTAGILWTTFFLLVFVFNQYFFRPWMIQRLTSRSSRPETDEQS